jgi:hypothetical protein
MTMPRPRPRPRERDRDRNRGLAEFVAAGPWPQRIALRTALALTARRRGRALLARLGPVLQVIDGLAAMSAYDEPNVARTLGWDAEAVVARGHELRRSEGRP